MHPSLSVSFYQWMEYVVMRRAERLLIGDFKERKNQSVMIWAFETWNEKKRSIVKARKHQVNVYTQYPLKQLSACKTRSVLSVISKALKLSLMIVVLV